MTISELHWFAGLLEGEGCFTSTHDFVPHIRIQMCDRDIIARAHKVLTPMTRICEAYTPKGRESWYISSTGSKAAAWMMTLYSLMGIRRQTRIREVLCAWRKRPARPNRIASNRELSKELQFARELVREFHIPQLTQEVENANR